jgi:hypothetical protein
MKDLPLTHRDARNCLTQAFWLEFGRQPTRQEVQLAQAVSWIESRYGAAFGHSNNMGAVHAGASWHGPTFTHAETSPNVDGTNTPYTGVFRAYASPAEGFRDLVRVIYRSQYWGAAALAAARTGQARDFSAALYHGGVNGYYEGSGGAKYDKLGVLVRSAADVRIDRHAASMRSALTVMCLALGEPMPDGSDPVIPRAPLRIGAAGADVRRVQAIVRVPVDGIYGPQTAAAVAVWQKIQGLKADGVVGPITRTAMGIP